MSKKTIAPVDIYEQDVRSNAVEYKVVLVYPAQSARECKYFTKKDDAISYAELAIIDIKRLRCVMIYARNEFDQYALVGTIKKSNKAFKEVK